MLSCEPPNSMVKISIVRDKDGFDLGVRVRRCPPLKNSNHLIGFRPVCPRQRHKATLGVASGLLNYDSLLVEYGGSTYYTALHSPLS